MYIEMNKRGMSVKKERREKKKGVKEVVCEDNESVVDMYGDEWRSVSVVVERWEELRSESKREEGIR